MIVYFGGNDSVYPHPSGLGPHVPLPEYIENIGKIAMHLKVNSSVDHYIFDPIAAFHDKDTRIWLLPISCF